MRQDETWKSKATCWEDDLNLHNQYINLKYNNYKIKYYYQLIYLLASWDAIASAIIASRFSSRVFWFDWEKRKWVCSAELGLTVTLFFSRNFSFSFIFIRAAPAASLTELVSILRPPSVLNNENEGTPVTCANHDVDGSKKQKMKTLQ